MGRLTSSPMLHPETEVSVMLLYLYTVSCIFLIIILGWLGGPPFSSIHFRVCHLLHHRPAPRLHRPARIGQQCPCNPARPSPDHCHCDVSTAENGPCRWAASPRTDAP